LTCYDYDGIEGIKAALREGEKLSTDKVELKF